MSNKGRQQFGVAFGGQRAEFMARALDSVPGVTRGGLAGKLLMRWAEGVLGEKAPAPDARGRHWSQGADPNGLTATARRLGIKPAELRKQLVKDALARLAANKTAAE